MHIIQTHQTSTHRKSNLPNLHDIAESQLVLTTSRTIFRKKCVGNHENNENILIEVEIVIMGELIYRVKFDVNSNAVCSK